MDQRTRLNLILATVTVALLLAVFSVSRRQDTPASPLLGELQDQTLTTIQIVNASQTISLIRENDQWKMTEPYQHTANEVQIEKMNQLLKIHSVSSFDSRGRDLAPYGLDEKALRVKLNDIDVRFGKTDPLNERRYMLVGNQVHLASRDIKYLFSMAPEAYLSTRLLPADASILALKLPTGSLILRQGEWEGSGQLASIKGDALTRLISEWQYAQALKISAYSKQNGDAVVVELSDGSIEYTLSREQDDFILAWPARGIQFHLTAETGKHLFLDNSGLENEVAE